MGFGVTPGPAALPRKDDASIPDYSMQFSVTQGPDIVGALGLTPST